MPVKLESCQPKPARILRELSQIDSVLTLQSAMWAQLNLLGLTGPNSIHPKGPGYGSGQTLGLPAGRDRIAAALGALDREGRRQRRNFRYAPAAPAARRTKTNTHRPTRRRGFFAGSSTTSGGGGGFGASGGKGVIGGRVRIGAVVLLEGIGASVGRRRAALSDAAAALSESSFGEELPAGCGISDINAPPLLPVSVRPCQPKAAVTPVKNHRPAFACLPPPLPSRP